MIFLPISRSSSGRERSDKPLLSGPPSSRPGPFIRGSSSKELLESQAPDEPRRDRDREGAEPRRPSVAEEKSEPERSRVRESGEGHNTGHTWEKNYLNIGKSPEAPHWYQVPIKHFEILFVTEVSAQYHDILFSLVSDTSVFMSTVKPEPVQTPERPALSEEEIGRKSKSIIDEFLHINDYKVLGFTGESTGDAQIAAEVLKAHQKLRKMSTINQ